MICKEPRDIPQLGSLLESDPYQVLKSQHGERLLKACLREVLEEARQRVLEGAEVSQQWLLEESQRRLEPAQTRVLNATGTILHTNLGRAPLGEPLRVVSERLRGYSVLEYDPRTGKRGKRGASVERLLRWLTGAEAALMVNNCSAAMVLLLTVLARDREVIVSRGELVEIGGSFRIPDILELSGARLVEVGTTNRTRIGDYRNAITEDTALLLTTHRSNFEIVGFTQSPSQEELIALGQEKGIPVVYDLGSGMLTPVVEGEPSVAEAVKFPLAAFSGDKLLGGPQCGILTGSLELVERCRKHPFYRAFRCDKLTLALMEEVLRRHARAPETVPALELLTASRVDLEKRARSLAQRLGKSRPQLEVRVVETEGQVGGGSLPGRGLPSWALVVTPDPESGSAAQFHKKLRRHQPGLVTRVENEEIVLDFRSLLPEEDEEVREVLETVFT